MSKVNIESVAEYCHIRIGRGEDPVIYHYDEGNVMYLLVVVASGGLNPDMRFVFMPRFKGSLRGYITIILCCRVEVFDKYICIVVSRDCQSTNERYCSQYLSHIRMPIDAQQGWFLPYFKL